MNSKMRKFTAAAAAFALAATITSCSAPEAITFGKSSQTALTVDGYEIPAGIFVYNEIYAYNSAAYTLYAQNGTYPSQKDVESATIENTDAAEWIQNQATDFCKDFVVTEREFAQIGDTLTEEEVQLVKDTLDSNENKEVFTENGVGKDSLKAIIENSYKQKHVFDHYFGLDSEFGCTEDELKEYFKDRTVRVNYLSISLKDSDGEDLDADTKHELDNKIKNYLREINEEPDDLAKMQKLNECRDDYQEFVAELKAKAEEESGETTTTTATTTTTTSESAETTTTTTDPYANEVTVTKYTTTTADESNSDSATTTTTAAAGTDDSKKAEQDYNDFLFNELEDYQAVRYDYDDSTIYIVIKGDISERMTDDDLWSDSSIDSLLQERYQQDFTDKMKAIADGYATERNSKAYRKYTPFKLTLDTNS